MFCPICQKLTKFLVTIMETSLPDLLRSLVIIIGCPLHNESKTLLLKVSHSLDTGLGAIRLGFT